jgi:hypothetical protein
MNDEIAVAQQISIRDVGLDEYWLQDQIVKNPACLGLGELEAIGKEGRQSSGGRLDILLKDPQDDSMYEVMLGATDETHIVRTIEYWDIEKRRWPQRQHFAVLIAQTINRRFYNVISLMSNSIPIIAIQASLLNVNGTRCLFLTSIVDTFEEIEDGLSLDDKIYSREDWIKKAKWTVDAADALLNITKTLFSEPVLNYLKYYIAIIVNGNNYLRLHNRRHNKSLLRFKVKQSLQEEAVKVLDAQNITFLRGAKPSRFGVTVDKEMIEKNATTFVAIADLVKKSWQSGAEF